jgi:hypothetical protein
MVSAEKHLGKRITGSSPFSLDKKITRDRQCLFLIMKRYPVEGKGDT